VLESTSQTGSISNKVIFKYEPKKDKQLFSGLDYDVFAQPEWHIIVFRVVHGLLLTGLAREVAKNAMKKILTKVFGPIDSENIRKQAIEVPLQYFTYTFVGFTVVYLAPLLLLNLGLYR